MDKDIIRILHVVGRMDRAGAETVIMNLYREIDRSKFQFDFVYFTTDYCDFDEEIESLGGRIHRIDKGNTAARFFALYRLFRSGDWIIVHSHTLFSSGLHLAAARLAGVPHRFAHSHNTQDANSNSLIGRTYQHLVRRLLEWSSTRFLACGAAAAGYLFPGREDVEIIPNGIDIAQFVQASGAAIRSEFGIREGQLVIVQVGRLMPVKNQVRSVKIADALKQSGVDFKLLLVGSGPEHSCIEILIKEFNLGEQVEMLGLRSDIPEVMAAADVMLMPSIYEGFGVVLLEAQATGLPSVVSSCLPREADFGLSMVNYVNLDAPDGAWVDTLLNVAKKPVPDAQTRFAVLDHTGFTSAASARRLEHVYSLA